MGKEGANKNEEETKDIGEGQRCGVIKAQTARHAPFPPPPPPPERRSAETVDGRGKMQQKR